MIAINTIIPALRDRVIFRQAVNPDNSQLDASLVTQANAVLTMHHPILTPENLEAIAPAFSSMIPAPVPTLNNLFSDWLLEQRDNAIKKVIFDVYNSKKNKRITKELLDEMNLYTGTGRADVIIKQDRLVGIEIEILPENNIVLALKRLAFQTTIAEAVTFHVYHSDLAQRVTTLTVTPTENGSMHWEVQNTLFPYQDFANNIVGGRWFIMYNETDLTGQAINKVLNIGVSPCASCHRRDYENYKKFTKFVRFRMTSVSANDKPADLQDRFDLDLLSLHYDTNFGMNLNFSVECDLTQLFVDHADLFADAIDKQMQADFLQEVVNTARSNVISEKMKQQANFALQDTKVGGYGVLEQLEKAKMALGAEMSDLSKSNCTPVEHRGVRWTSAHV